MEFNRVSPPPKEAEATYLTVVSYKLPLLGVALATLGYVEIGKKSHGAIATLLRSKSFEVRSDNGVRISLIIQDL